GSDRLPSGRGLVRLPTESGRAGRSGLASAGCAALVRSVRGVTGGEPDPAEQGRAVAASVPARFADEKSSSDAPAAAAVQAARGAGSKPVAVLPVPGVAPRFSRPRAGADFIENAEDARLGMRHG